MSGAACADDFRDLVLHYATVQRIDIEGGSAIVRMKTARGEGFARVPVADLEVSEARDLIEGVIQDCPFA